MNDPFDLQRFVAAQNAGGTYDQALRELKAGRKTSHWMWFVFPQVAGLGRSEMAQRYAISGLPEAKAYLAHPTLGPRLIECSNALLQLSGHDPVAIFGSIDAQKLQSSMTLFAYAEPTHTLFSEVLVRYFSRVEDTGTVERLVSRDS